MTTSAGFSNLRGMRRPQLRSDSLSEAIPGQLADFAQTPGWKSSAQFCNFCHSDFQHVETIKVLHVLISRRAPTAAAA